ncbi:glycosyltransferase [Nocardioides oleivorans]|uniref:Glycosyltransferase n=1 Tax=Nocardioides oleivorans TaxID=273676 RepID=A0A4V1RLC0_9ACTN|nr:glycosyltransferase [Nocardioides oleivorans]RYB95252.1 glycosyltransferase [Nocardioides oleivorans]
MSGTLQVFVPFWGDPGLLYATVDSVRAQTDGAWTLTVVDDCYPDPSVALHFAEEADERITYVRNETNLGITGNFERCRRLASEDLVMFLGCDDLLHPSFVERARTVMAAHPDAAFLQMGVRVIDESGAESMPVGDRIKALLRPRSGSTVEISGEDLAVSLLRGNWLYWPSLVFRRTWLPQRPFREDLPIILDLAFIMDVVRAGGALVLDSHVAFSYRRHSESLSSAAALDGTRFADDRRYFREIGQELTADGWPRAARAARHRWISRLHGLTLVPDAMRSPDRSTAMRHIWTHLTR